MAIERTELRYIGTIIGVSSATQALHLVRVDVPEGIQTVTSVPVTAYFNRTPEGTVEESDFLTDGMASAVITDVDFQPVSLATNASLTSTIGLATLNEGVGTITLTTSSSADAGTIAVIGEDVEGNTLNESLMFAAGGEAQTTTGAYAEVTSATPSVFTTGTVGVVLNNNKAYVLTITRDLDDSGVLKIGLNPS